MIIGRTHDRQNEHKWLFTMGLYRGTLVNHLQFSILLVCNFKRIQYNFSKSFIKGNALITIIKFTKTKTKLTNYCNFNYFSEWNEWMCAIISALIYNNIVLSILINLHRSPYTIYIKTICIFHRSYWNRKKSLYILKYGARSVIIIMRYSFIYGLVQKWRTGKIN